MTFLWQAKELLHLRLLNKPLQADIIISRYHACISKLPYFHPANNTFEEEKQPKVKVEMTGKGLTIYEGLLPVLNFMKALEFREKVRKEVPIGRAANAKYEMMDAIKMIVIGLMADATAMEWSSL